MCVDSSPLERAVQFHGHVCPGLLMGLRAAEFALAYLDTDRDYDEELIAVVENDSCAVDAIQAVLGCTFGKGNLIFKDYGKQVYTIISREQKKAVRLSAKMGTREGPDYERFRALNARENLSDEEETERENLRGVLFEDIMSRPFETLFDYREVELEIPERARIHQTIKCDSCGEGVMATRVVTTGQGNLCRECYDRQGVS
jgi:formylmethanofuran dehydrogenase subunit E